MAEATTVKISPTTLSILSNFATIRPEFAQWEDSNIIYTRSIVDGMRVYATLDSVIPKTLRVDNLSDFLSVLSLFSSPLIEFSSGVQVSIKEDGKKTSTNYEMLKESMAKEKAAPMRFPPISATPAITFDLKEDTIKQIKKAADVLGLDFVIFEITEGEITIRLKTSGKEDGKTRQYEYEAGVVTGGTNVENTYVLGVKLEYLKLLMSGEYKVQMDLPHGGNSGFFILTNKKVNINYFIMLDQIKVS